MRRAQRRAASSEGVQERCGPRCLGSRSLPESELRGETDAGLVDALDQARVEHQGARELVAVERDLLVREVVLAHVSANHEPGRRCAEECRQLGPQRGIDRHVGQTWLFDVDDDVEAAPEC
jgi:hypothetical protein